MLLLCDWKDPLVKFPRFEYLDPLFLEKVLNISIHIFLVADLTLSVIQIITVPAQHGKSTRNCFDLFEQTETCRT